MTESEASLTDVYRKIQDLHDTMIGIRTELHLIREATYGETSTEAQGGIRWDNPKFGSFGATGEASDQIQGILSNIDRNIQEIRLKQK